MSHVSFSTATKATNNNELTPFVNEQVSGESSITTAITAIKTPIKKCDNNEHVHDDAIPPSDGNTNHNGILRNSSYGFYHDHDDDDDDGASAIGYGTTQQQQQQHQQQSDLKPSRPSGFFNRQDSMEYHTKSLFRDLRESFVDLRDSFVADFTGRRSEPSLRSRKRHRLNKIFASLLLVTVTILIFIVSMYVYQRVYLPRHRQHLLTKRIAAHAAAAAQRAQQCQQYDWQMACDALGSEGAGARRQRQRKLYTGIMDRSNELEEAYLNSDDPRVTYDEFCLRVYRLELFGGITFPYHSGQLLTQGGNQTMALFVQHGALRNPEDYFCSFKELMLKQPYRNFQDVLIVAPNFQYEKDELVHPYDAFWNSSKPWGDWRVGAESDPNCCGNLVGEGPPRTISSFEVLDNFLAILTDKDLFPNMNKISYVGHSAGGQMVQRYAIMSVLASLWALTDDVDVEFIVANPSSYTYLTPERYEYSCGNCDCNRHNCTCDQDCSPNPPYTKLGRPLIATAGITFPCYQWNWDRWPYGIGSFTDKNGRYIPYALRDGKLGVVRAKRLYEKLHVVYMVGQNDTCNDGLPTCDASCWKRDVWKEPEEWKCFRNSMDTRCPAMLQGPCRNTRGHQYMSYLEHVYGRPTHTLHEVPGVGHDASGMFGSETGMKEIFGGP